MRSMPTISRAWRKVAFAEHAAWSYIEVFAHRIHDGPLQLRHTRERLQSLGVKEHDLTPMPKNDLKIRKSIKYTGKNKSKKLNSQS
jgi:hypothetical protein